MAVVPRRLPRRRIAGGRTARADRVVERVRNIGGNVLLFFSSGHFLRMLATRWIGAEPLVGRSFMLSTASLSGLSRDRQDPVILLWNDTAHVVTSQKPESSLVHAGAK